jgi:hypothetical protein
MSGCLLRAAKWRGLDTPTPADIDTEITAHRRKPEPRHLRRGEVIRAVTDTNVLVYGVLWPTSNEALILLAIHQGLVHRQITPCTIALCFWTVRGRSAW